MIGLHSDTPVLQVHRDKGSNKLYYHEVTLSSIAKDGNMRSVEEVSVMCTRPHTSNVAVTLKYIL